MRKAVILFGHGSRDPQWRAPIEAVARRLRQAEPAIDVHCAYLELDTPDLLAAARTAIDSGAGEVAVVPMFLGIGRHAREDLPSLVDALRAEFPSVRITLRAAVGEDPRVLDLLAKIAGE